MSTYSRFFYSVLLVVSVQCIAGATEPVPADTLLSNIRVYDRASIDGSGWLTLGDFLSNLSQTGTAAGRGMNAFTGGQQTVNLHNLGADRTLILINGRRLVSGARSSVDLSTYPLSAIERIEVSSSGGSAAAGSGAVAGTINLVSRLSQNGLQVAGQIGEFDSGDGRSQHLDVGYGRSFERGSYYVNLSILDADPIAGGGREISASRPFGSGTAFGSSATPQGRFGAGSLGSFSLTTNPGSLVDGPEDFREGDFSFGQPGSGQDRFNNAAEEFVLHQRERQSILATSQWSLTDTLQLEVDALYSHRDALLQFAPPTLNLGLFGVSPAGAPTIAIDNVFNPFGISFAGDDYGLARRLSEAGNRRFLLEAKEYRLAGALSGSLNIAGSPWQWQAQWVHSSLDTEENRPFQMDYQRIAQSLSGQPCRDDAFGDGCVELNVFGGQGPDGQGTVTPAMLEYISFDANDRLSSDLDQLTFDLATEGPTLGGGEVSWGMGLDWRREQSQFDLGPTVTGVFSNRARVNRQSREILAVTARASLPFTEALSGDLEARYADPNKIDSVTAGRAALNWTIASNVSMQLEGSQDFVLPRFDQQLDAQVQAPVQVADPCETDASLTGCSSSNGAADSLNPEAEIAQQWRLGIQWQPDGWNLNTHAGYRRLSLDDVLSVLNAQQLVNACSFTDRHCQFVSRTAVGGIMREASAPLFATVNDGNIDVDTLDLGADWSSESGRWQVSGQAQYTMDFERTTPQYVTVPGQAVLTAERLRNSDLGEVNGVNLIPRLRANLDARWQSGNWRAVWGVRYTHRVREQCRQQAFGLCNLDLNGDTLLDGRRLGATTYHDVQLGYDMAAYNTQLTLGVQNLLDKNPPLSSAAAGNYYTNDYRTPGRYPYVRLSVTF